MQIYYTIQFDIVRVGSGKEGREILEYFGIASIRVVKPRSIDQIDRSRRIVFEGEDVDLAGICRRTLC